MHFQINFLRKNFEKLSCLIINETAGYRQHVFRSPISVKLVFCENNLIFFEETLFLLNCSCFPNFEKFPVFSKKTFTIKKRRLFLIQSYFIRIVQRVHHLYRVCRYPTFFLGKTHLIIEETTKFFCLTLIEKTLDVSIVYDKIQYGDSSTAKSTKNSKNR